MTQYLALGFELELFNPFEYSAVHYNMDYIFGMMYNNKENQYKSTAKKKKKQMRDIEQACLYLNCC
jgi:hypothetical protein